MAWWENGDPQKSKEPKKKKKKKKKRKKRKKTKVKELGEKKTIENITKHLNREIP